MLKILNGGKLYFKKKLMNEKKLLTVYTLKDIQEQLIESFLNI